MTPVDPAVEAGLHLDVHGYQQLWRAAAEELRGHGMGLRGWHTLGAINNKLTQQAEVTLLHSLTHTRPLHKMMIDREFQW